MSVLKNLFRASARPESIPPGPETAPVKMNLEERMEFRREMLYEAIKVTMQAHGILSASYRFRVVRNDRRGHMYSVLMDLSTDFMHKREGRPEHLNAVGAAIGKNAATRYSILVAGVYWRVDDQIQGFETSRPEAAHGVGESKAPSLPLRLRDRIYATDLAPLGDVPEGDSQR